MINHLKNDFNIYRQFIEINILCNSYSKKMTARIECLLTEISQFLMEFNPDKANDVKRLKHYTSKLERIHIITQDWMFGKFINYDEYEEHTPKNFQIVRKYGDKLKIIGKERPPKKNPKRDPSTFRHNTTKLPTSLSRTKSKIYELIMLNDWDYFVNFTIDNKKFKRCNLDAYIKSFTKWLNNYSVRKNPNRRITYLLVPECGKKNSYHVHGVMNGIPPERLSPFESGKHPAHLVNSSYLNWKDYEKKFGYCSINYGIRSKEAVAKYITKKITKYSNTRKCELNKRLYFCSKGLNRSCEIARGYDIVPDIHFDYENDYIGIKWLDGGFQE